MFSPELKSALGPLALRVGVAGILMSHGALKVATGATTWNPDLTPSVQAVVAWAELLAGAFLLLGLLTRPASAVVIALQMGAIALVTGAKGLIAIGMLPAAAAPKTMHVEVGWEYNLALITLCVGLFFLGGGMIALDHYLWGRRRAAPEAGAHRAEAAVYTPIG
jgi:putative oxidoreductase